MLDHMKTAQINAQAIWLNGPAGAGKTSLAKALLEYISAAKRFSSA